MVKKSGANGNQQESSDTQMAAPSDNVDLFVARFNLEKEIKRIWVRHVGREPIPSDHATLVKQLLDLYLWGYLSKDVMGVIKEIVAICSYGIHDKSVTKFQLDFVKNNTRDVLSYLAAI